MPFFRSFLYAPRTRTSVSRTIKSIIANLFRSRSSTCSIRARSHFSKGSISIIPTRRPSPGRARRRSRPRSVIPTTEAATELNADHRKTWFRRFRPKTELFDQVGRRVDFLHPFSVAAPVRMEHRRELLSSFRRRRLKVGRRGENFFGRLTARELSELGKNPKNASRVKYRDFKRLAVQFISLSFEIR